MNNKITLIQGSSSQFNRKSKIRNQYCPNVPEKKGFRLDK